MLNPHLSTLLAQLKLHGFTQSLDSNIDAVYSGEINFEEAIEPYRVCRRVNILRDYPDDKTKLYPRN